MNLVLSRSIVLSNCIHLSALGIKNISYYSYSLANSFEYCKTFWWLEENLLNRGQPVLVDGSRGQNQ